MYMNNLQPRRLTFENNSTNIPRLPLAEIAKKLYNDTLLLRSDPERLNDIKVHASRLFDADSKDYRSYMMFVDWYASVPEEEFKQDYADIMRNLEHEFRHEFPSAIGGSRRKSKKGKSKTSHKSVRKSSRKSRNKK